MVRRGESATLGEVVYERLRREVLNGVFQPGERLQPGELRVRFGVSVGVMREALTRLAESHLVVVAPNHGFRVVELTGEEIADLTRVRCTVEGLALQMAVERGGLDWQSTVVAAHYRLTRTPLSLSGVPGIVTEEWTSAHGGFHRVLIEACGVPSLIAMCESLSDAMALFRNSTLRPVGAGSGNPSLDRSVTAADEHQAIVDAVLARDIDLAVAHLATHYESTARMSSALLGPDPSAVASGPSVTS